MDFHEEKILKTVCCNFYYYYNVINVSSKEFVNCFDKCIQKYSLIYNTYTAVIM